MMSINGSIFLFLLVSVSSPMSTAMEEDMRAEKGNCYYDLPRLLPKHLLNSHKMVPKLCKEKCGLQQYKYAGVQNYNECWCGNSPPPASKKINQFKCNRACKGDKKLMCGGGYKMNIYKVEPEDFMHVIKKYKKHYLGLKNTAKHARKYFEKARELLPMLLDADALDQNEVGVAYEVTHPKKYPLALLTGKNIKTVRHPKQSVAINGTVNKVIGKRSYRLAIYRPTGLYAKPGDIITITIPQELVGKISAKVGHDNGWYIEFPLRKSTQKIGSPWGGLIVIKLKDIDATSQQGQFNVQIENAIQAPYFVYGKNTNAEWNNSIKKNAAPWAIFRIPGELQMFIRTEKVNKLNDMEGIMKKWKRTMDVLDELVGIPLNVQPGEEQLHFRADIGGGGGRNGYATCAGGGQMYCGNSYEPDFPRGGFHVAYHELGHGACYKNLPNMGDQMTADIVAQYMERTTGRDGLQHMIDVHDYSPKESEYWNFNLLYTMASFAKFSNGKACGKLTFRRRNACDFENPHGDTCRRSSYTVTEYYDCWTDLYQLPLWDFGWDVLRKVFSSAGQSSESYNSKTDRMADLYCKATKKNLIPLFNFYNIKVSKSIAEPCEKQEKPNMITKYINIANCIKNEDIKKCTKLPGFPEHKGICTFNGVCHKSPDYNDQTKTMKDEFDLWGGTFNKNLKRGRRGTGQIKNNCLSRAQEMWRWCRNDLSQRITTTFTPSNGKANSTYTYPRPVSVWEERQKIFSDKQCRNIGRRVVDITGCKKACDDTSNCSAFNIRLHGTGCVLRACPFRIQDPNWDYSGYNSYFKKISVWEERQKIFSDKQCRNIGWRGVDISGCKKACDDTSNCSAFNIRLHGTGCVLRACPFRIQDPNWDYSGYKSYFKKSQLMVKI